MNGTLTPMLLIRGCPVDRLDEAAAILRAQEVPFSHQDYVEQVDAVVMHLLHGIPLPFCDHQWTQWYKYKLVINYAWRRDCSLCGKGQTR